MARKRSASSALCPLSLEIDGASISPAPARTLSLANLPEEIMSHIAIELGCDDLCALRLTCKSLQAGTLHDFATEHFSSKAFMLTTESLNVLVGIASNKRLWNKLRSITLTTAFFIKHDHHCPHYQPTLRQSEAYQDYVNDQGALRAAGTDRRKLAQAFKKLGSITNLIFVDHPSCIKPGTDYRGSNRVLRRTGTTPIYAVSKHIETAFAEYKPWQSHVWKVTLQAVADAGTTVANLDASQLDVFGLTAHNFKLGSKTLARLQTSFQILEHLHLHINGSGNLIKNSQAIRAFANVVGKNPKGLHVRYEPNDNIDRIHASLVAGLSLSNLTELSIGTLSFAVAEMVKTINAVSSVVKLHLISINLTGKDWIPVLKAMQKLENLEELHLMCLGQDKHKVYFLAKPDPTDAPRTCCHHHMLEDEADMFDDEIYDPDAFLADDDDEESLSGSDAGGASPSNANSHAAPTKGATKAPAKPADEFQGPHCGPGYTFPDSDVSYVRGYYVCAHGKEKIAKHLPIFIEQYYQGGRLDAAEDDDLAMHMHLVVPAPGTHVHPPQGAPAAPHQADAGAAGVGH